MQIKPHTVEAVLFFNDDGVCKEMLFPEFEAMLDGVVNMPEFADQQIRMAYVLINPRLQIRAAVLFCLDFNEDGSADSGWNIPLRNLAESTGRGPDLGAGPIRLACRSQCPTAWHQMHLWDPDVTAENNHFDMIRERIKRNQLGLLVDDEALQNEPAERLQLVADEARDALEQRSELTRLRAQKDDREQRAKAAQLIKLQRTRIASLEQQHEADVAKLSSLAAQQQNQLRDELDQLRERLRLQEELNAELVAQLSAQAEKFQQNRAEMSQQLRALEDSSRAEAKATRGLFVVEMQEEVAAAVAEYKAQVAIRDVELGYRNELDSELQREIEQLMHQRDALIEQSAEKVLERLSRQGVKFIAYHHGAGHLTIPLHDLDSYQQNPEAYAAGKCAVSEAQYRQWREHVQQPSCSAKLPNGERCAMPLDKIDSPALFILDESNCCARHRASGRLSTGS